MSDSGAEYIETIGDPEAKVARDKDDEMVKGNERKEKKRKGGTVTVSGKVAAEHCTLEPHSKMNSHSSVMPRLWITKHANSKLSLKWCLFFFFFFSKFVFSYCISLIKINWFRALHFVFKFEFQTKARKIGKRIKEDGKLGWLFWLAFVPNCYAHSTKKKNPSFIFIVSPFCISSSP